MIYKDFIENLSKILNYSKAKTSTYTHKLINIIHEVSAKEDVDIKGFGKMHFPKEGKPKLEPYEKLIKEINIK